MGDKNMIKQFKCCLCNKKVNGIGNNPAPLKKSGLCCEKCNIEKVIPKRLGVYSL
jgi:hypothetical protein